LSHVRERVLEGPQRCLDSDERFVRIKFSRED
jgi:hypothetical protein